MCVLAISLFQKPADYSETTGCPLLSTTDSQIKQAGAAELTTSARTTFRWHLHNEEDDQQSLLGTAKPLSTSEEFISAASDVEEDSQSVTSFSSENITVKDFDTDDDSD